MELTRLILVYVHLIACCVAIGLVLTNDITAIKKLAVGDPYEQDDLEHLRYLKTAVCISLSVLWCSGIALVALDASMEGLDYYTNPKLHAKIIVVVLLTLNGFVLHGTVLPALETFGSLVRLPYQSQILAAFVGAVSGVSWFYAAMLGVGRSLSWQYSLFELLVAYPFILAGAFTIIATLIFWARARLRSGVQSSLASDR
jgi:hypothetical protein